MPRKSTTVDLTGRFFVTASPDGGLHHQGRIKGPVNPDKTAYLVCAYEWTMGAETGEFLIPLEDIVRYFRLTSTHADEHDSYCQAHQRSDYDAEFKARKVPQIGRPAYSLGYGPLSA